MYSFQGLFKLYQLPAEMKEANKLRYFNRVRESKPAECIIRVYIVRAIELSPKDPNGKADPFIMLELGKKKVNDKDNYIPNTINPYFGAFFEIRAKIPLVKDLKIKVMDYDLMSSNDLIGETVVDLENRFLTQHRATCGLPARYYK